jgi:2-keto-4-pentenoate hydratase/2-oxohepta-3-ene-1,7-dioic acid hydratase in catechol pathway
MNARWSLVTYRDGDQLAVGALDADGRVVAVPEAAAGAGLMAIIDDWDRVRGALEGWSPAGAQPVAGAKLLAPLLYPRKLICAGATYRDHLEEMGLAEIPDPLEPFFFLLPPTTTIVGPGAAIRIPADPAWRVDWEAELAVVIGRRGRAIAAADARAHVAGYTILNDVSARGRHRRANPLGPPFAFDWLGSKGADTFCPMGPGVTPDWLVDDPQDLAVRCSVNGEVKQDGTTVHMLNDVWRLIEAVSEAMTLEPGDVIATGTPAGVGAARGEQLAGGDRVRIEIAGLGTLENPVVTVDADSPQR